MGEASQFIVPAMTWCVLVVALLAVATGMPRHTSWSDCSGGRLPGKVSNVSWTPSEPVVGLNSTLTINLNFAGMISHGMTHHIKVLIDGKLPILDKDKLDVCRAETAGLPLKMGHIALEGMKCPQVGSNNIIMKNHVMLMKDVVSGHKPVELDFMLEDHTHAMVMCLKITVDLKTTHNREVDELHI